MLVVKSPEKLTKSIVELKSKGKKIGFVPTMGFLHKGHLSLVRKSKKECDFTVVSIFVNPTQFGPKEDLSRYPRNLRRDSQMLRKAKVDFLFFPSANDIYPKGFCDFVNPGPLAKGLCGAKRPGHFRGVATVVNRLFQIVPANVAYFGQKDFQQARVIQDMVERFQIPTKIRICPIVREKDGLAMSSRNVYLSKSERIRAKSLSGSLRHAARLIRQGARNPAKIRAEMMRILKSNTDKIDYAAIVDSKRLRAQKHLKNTCLIAVACFVGKTRLIDNILVRV